MKVIGHIKSQPWIDRLYCAWVRRKSSRISVQPGNTVDFAHARIVRSQIEISGTGNRLILKPHARFYDCHLEVRATDAVIEIGDWCRFIKCHFVVEGTGSYLRFGQHATGTEVTYTVAGCEGGITIGSDCMTGAGTNIRNTDSHSILDKETGMRINHEQNVHIGDHVWLGTGVTVLKGCRIGSGAIVGSMSLARGELEGECIHAGNPTQVIRRNVTWDRRRIQEQSPGQDPLAGLEQSPDSD